MSEYPWQASYNKVVLATDQSVLRKLIKQAEEDIRLRLESPEPFEGEEGCVFERTVEALSVLKSAKF
jgi:hypothetical protein